MGSIHTTNFRRRVIDFFEFVGPRTSFLMFAGVIAGIGTFFAELGLAYGLQAFLLALGIAKESSVELPNFVPSKEIGSVLAFLFAATLLRGLFGWASFVLQTATNSFFSKLQRTRLLRWAFHSKSMSTSELVTLFTERTQNAAGAMMYLQTCIIQLTLAGFLGITLLRLSPRTTIISALSLLVLAWPIRAISKRVKTAGEGLTRDWDQLSHRLIVSVRNLLLLRLYNVHESERRRAQAHLDGYIKHQLNQGFAAGALGAVPQVVGIGLICIIVAVGQKDSRLPSGVLLSYFYLFARLLQNLSMSMQALSNVTFYWPQLSALLKWRNAHRETDNEPAPEARLSSDSAPVVLGWEFDCVSFRYDSESPFILKNFSATIPAGQTTVISGPSGAGKSTILNLILSEISATEGEVILFSGGEKRRVEGNIQAHLHAIGYVGPESFLVEGSLRENLCFGLKREVSDSEILALSEQAECQFIRDLPAGLDHALTEQGQGLSAGQKQRLALLRALLRNPTVLILDEATSNLDEETELRLISTLSSLKANLTIVAVTHRQALLKIADVHLQIAPTLASTEP